jgi:signal transduction histidine kinase
MDAPINQTENEGKIKIGYLSAFFLLLISFLLTYYTNRGLIKNAENIQRTNQVISNLEALLSAVKDGETGLRGYFNTSNVFYLDPYYGSSKAADSIVRETSRLLDGNSIQADSLKSLQVMVKKKYAYLENNIQSFNNNNQIISPALKDSLYESKLVMDSLRVAVKEMRKTEELLLERRSNRLSRTSEALFSIVIASIIIAFFLVVFGFFTHLTESKKRTEAQHKVLIYQQQLQNRIGQLAKANIELVSMRSLEKFAATGRIARTIAHEIRNPLTNINLATNQLKTELAVENEETSFLFDMINRNSQRINQLISDLLTSTKFSELNVEKLTVNDLLEEALVEATDRIRLNEVTLLKTFELNMPKIAVDKGKMKIALLNIIINGIESMEGQTNKLLTIQTSLDKAFKKCVIKITDTGTGMSHESLSKLFEPYFTNKKNGNGLGLTNTQNIILNHKGEIHVASEPNEGTSFEITLDAA